MLLMIPRVMVGYLCNVCYGLANEVFLSALADSALAHLATRDCLAGKSVILVGNKTDLARSRLVQAEDSCDAAVMAGVKFVETSAMIGHMTDQLLVGIVMQCRQVLGVKCVQPYSLRYFRIKNENQKKDGSHLKVSIKEMLGFTRRGSKRRKECRNLNV